MNAARPASGDSRWKRAAFGIAFAAAAIGCAAGAWASLGGAVASLLAGMPNVQFHPRDAILFPLTIAFASFAAMALLPDLEIDRRPSRRSPSARFANRVAGWLMGAAMICVVAASVASLAAFAVVDHIARRHGYAECPPPGSIRSDLRQWAKRLSACQRDAE